MWISRKEFDMLEERVKKLEWFAREFHHGIYVDGRGNISNSDAFTLILHHLGIEIVKPDCSLVIRPLQRNKQKPQATDD